MELAKRLAADHAMRIIWCASDTDAAPDLPGVTPRPMRTWNVVERTTGMPYPLWGIGSLIRLARAIREADAVHVHDCIYLGSLFAATLAKWYGKRLVVTQHIGEKELASPVLRIAYPVANRLAARLVLLRAEVVFFISLLGKAYFESLLGQRPTFAYLPNGVDLDLFRPGSPAEARNTRASRSLAPDAPVLLFVGRFVETKGLAIIREVAATRPEWTWCFAGNGPVRPESWGLPNVHVLGRLEPLELVAWYHAVDLLVLPSRIEGFPLIVQEAMACGLNVLVRAKVAAGAPLPPRLVQVANDEDNSGAAWVAAIARFLALPQDERMTKGESAAQFAQSHWDWNRTSATTARALTGDTRSVAEV